MKNILVPIDHSPTALNALRYAILFAQRENAAIEVVHVLPPEYQPANNPITVTTLTNNLIRNAEKLNTATINNAITQIQASHQLKALPSISQSVEIGIPVSKILDIVKTEDFDAMIVGTQGEHSSLEKILGTVSSGLVKNASIPILIIPENYNYKEIKKACVAVNLMESDIFEIHKACQLLPPSLKQLDILHVYSNKSLSQTEIEMNDLEQYHDQHNRDYQFKYISKESSNVSQAILEYTTREEIDILVVIGPHLSGIKKWFFESNSKKLTYQTEIPILRI